MLLFPIFCQFTPKTRRLCPVLGSLPDKFRIVRRIDGDPADILTLNPNPPPFLPTGRYTTERHDIIDKLHPGDFLLTTEHDMMHCGTRRW
ncbi:hypothetical protein C8J57DRAFT_1073586 [Mycena rebaudengoi]|nr:hypothetical protein C8J57DRAFT_1073586 [Mycena rebaudengoi]